MKAKAFVSCFVAAMAAGAFAADAYIEGDGTQAIVTDYYPNPATKIVADYAYTATTPTQMAVFGCEGNLVVRHYINGSGGYAFAFRDSSGDWLPVVPSGQLTVTTDRRTFVLDGPNKTATLYTDGEVTATRATATATKTASMPLAIFAYTSSWYLSGQSGCAKLRLYSLAIYENDAIVHYYKPYRSIDGKFSGLKDLCTGKILIDYLSFAPFACGGDISDDPTWDLDGVAQPAYNTPTYVDDTGDDLVIDAPLGAWVLETPISTTKRTVKTGRGAVVLPNGNTFGDEFAVTNGFVAADYAASGLSSTHITLFGTNNMFPGMLVPFGSTFTAPVAASGAGTIRITGWAGFRPFDADLTVNLGGDGRLLTNGEDGFTPTEFDLCWSRHHTLTFENDLALNARSFILKNSLMSNQKPMYLTGRITDTYPTGNGSDIKYYDGPAVFVGREGRVDIEGLRGWLMYSGSQYFSNITFRARKDVNFGGGAALAVATFKDCDKWGTDAWDFINGNPGTMLTVDGGRWSSPLRFNIGYTTAGKTGTLIITNDAQFSLSCLRQNSGVINMYSGMFAITNSGDNSDSAIGRRGDNNEQAPLSSSADSVFNLYGGTLRVRDGINFQIGGTHRGTLNQTSGTFSANAWMCVGRYAAGNGLYNLHGGEYVRRGDGYSDVIVGELGTGVVSVANGGVFSGRATAGVRIGQNAGSMGAFIVSPDGTVTTRKFYGGSGAGSLVFNGGTVKAYDASASSAFIASDLARATVTHYGGTFDTDGKGDFTFAKPLLAAANANEVSETLAHRWTFDGASLADPLGGADATTVGNVTWTNGAIRLTGGANGSSQVNLGTDIFPKDGRGATIEMWVTLKAFSKWARLVECGYSRGEGANTNFFISANVGSSTNPWRFRVGFVGEITATHVMQMNRMYHVAATFDPRPDGRWICRAALHDPATGALIDELVYTSAVGWKFQNMRFNDGCWLGHSSYDADNDPNAEYHDIRIHHRALTEAQLTASATNGPAYRFAFRKKGTGMLTLTGASTYKADTAVDGGALKLASGATLPATGMSVASGATLDLNGATQAAERLEGAGTVKGGTLAVAGPILPGGEGTIGTLTVDGTALTSGTLVVDAASDGTCDCLASTGALDLSHLSFALGEGSSLDETKIYTVATAPSFTGAFSDAELPNFKWRLVVVGTKAKLVYSNGTAVIFR
ncbi:MAG: hypothetical protein IJL17_08465 [Kiritimatiellae bacterium]|nr:hypothetical protein [Kiritimatiellia bacterium]